MVFSTKADLDPKRPLSEKMLINAWKYRDDFEESMKLMSNVGFKYVNIGTWFNQKDGMPDFTGEIDKTREALEVCKKYNLKPMINFNGSTNGYLDTTTFNGFHPEQLKVIKQNLSEIFKTFAKMGIIWANWNEPDNVFWAPWDARDMPQVIHSWVNMSKWIIRETAKYDSEALNVVYSSVTGVETEDKKIINQIVDEGLFDHALGGVAHTYVAQEFNNGAPEIMMKLHEETIGGKPLLTNEYGYSRRDVEGDTWQGSWTIEESAKLTARQTIIQDYLNYSIIGIYCDLGNSYHIEDDGFELNLVGQTVVNMVHALDGYTIKEKVEVRNHKDYMDDLYVFIYSKAGSPDKVVYWAPKNTGHEEIEIYGSKLRLHFTDNVQIMTPDFTPTQKEYFPDIKQDTSLGTRLM